MRPAGGVTVISRYRPGYVLDKCEWRPSGIHVARDGHGARFEPGRLTEALDMLLHGGSGQQTAGDRHATR